jgi:S-adenosylmethionine decarboxylase
MQMSGIDRLLPLGTVVDSHLFDPCGYSMNGIIEGTDRYVTIHITPEPAFSYVSFETNQDQKCLFEQTIRVLKCFR